MTEQNRDNMFKKGTLLAYKGKKGTDKGFIVLVTKGRKKDLDNFKGIVIASGNESIWEIGHNSNCWAKSAEYWEVVDIPTNLY